VLEELLRSTGDKKAVRALDILRCEKSHVYLALVYFIGWCTYISSSSLQHLCLIERLSFFSKISQPWQKWGSVCGTKYWISPKFDDQVEVSSSSVVGDTTVNDSEGHRRLCSASTL